jgi:hypothetical protein
MTPTDAQKVYYLKSILGNLQEFRSLAVTEPSIGGEVLSDNINWLDCHIAALTAAAEVGPTQEDIEKAKEICANIDDTATRLLVKTVRLEERERCARVADELAAKVFDDPWLKEAAAAIRALKDEP